MHGFYSKQHTILHAETHTGLDLTGAVLKLIWDRAIIPISM